MKKSITMKSYERFLVNEVENKFYVALKVKLRLNEGHAKKAIGTRLVPIFIFQVSDISMMRSGKTAELRIKAILASKLISKCEVLSNFECYLNMKQFVKN